MWRKWILTVVLTGSWAGAGILPVAHARSAEPARFATPAAVPSAAAQGAKFLTNDDVVAMVKAGQNDDAIVNAIQTQGTDFDVSAKAVFALKKSAVPKKVIDAMLAAVKDQKEAAAAVLSAAQSKAAGDEAEEKAELAKQEAARTARSAGPVTGTGTMGAAVPGLPSVTMATGGQKQPLVAAHTQIVPTNTQIGPNDSQASMNGLAADGGLSKNLSSLAQMFAGGMGPGGGMPGAGGMKPGLASTMMMANPIIGPAFLAGSFLAKKKMASQAAAAGSGPGGQGAMTAVWAIPGVKSETIVRGGQPLFEVQFDAIAGVNPDDYEPVLIRLTPSQSNFRLVGATSATANQMQNSQADWNLYASFIEQRVPGQATKVSSGHYQLQPSSSLGAGEYGVVLRPINKDKKFAGSSVGQNVGDGLIFNCVWSFEVQ